MNLISKLEAATGPDRELDAEIHALKLGKTVKKICLGGIWFDADERSYDPPNYSSSIDSALTLATGNALPILRWAIDMLHDEDLSIEHLPRFICIAIMKARAE